MSSPDTTAEDMSDLVAENARLRDGLQAAADRFADLGAVISENGSYNNAGFMINTARRCMRVLKGGTFNGAV